MIGFKQNLIEKGKYNAICKWRKGGRILALQGCQFNYFFRKALEQINSFIVSNWKIIIMHNNCNQETKVNQEKEKVS